jgi:predicted unusual protein kinase regulating ubiquinone biosynthesis (AarF/ABC1/UbiB family)
MPSLAAGVKITDMQRLQAAGVPTELVARRATEAYLMQVRPCR